MNDININPQNALRYLTESQPISIWKYDYSQKMKEAPVQNNDNIVKEKPVAVKKQNIADVNKQIAIQQNEISKKTQFVESNIMSSKYWNKQ